MQPNKQRIEKQLLSIDGDLAVHSIFKTIQGEGPFAGLPATFVRLAGCNLQCPLCDTDYTGIRNVYAYPDLVREVEQNALPSKLVVLTGGEPFRQNITPFVNRLIEKGFRVQVETNGTLYLPTFPYDKVMVVCSPKAGTVNKLLAPHIRAYKYVVSADDVSELDGLPIKALEHSASPQVARPPADFRGLVYIQPVDEQDSIRNALHTQTAVESSMKYGYILCLQLHKILNME